MTDGFIIEQTEDIDQFEQQLLQYARAEIRQSKHDRGKWNRLLQLYIRQKAILEIFPLPDWLDEGRDSLNDDDSIIPSIKHITQNIDPRYDHFYRWGLKLTGTPNYRVIYTVQDYWKVILLHHFVKQYNGSIKAEDIRAAIERYEQHLIK